MNIMKLRPLFFIVSMALLGISAFSIFRFGFVESIDFAGGTVWEISFPSIPDKAKIEEIFQKNEVGLSSLSSTGSNFTIKSAAIEPDKKAVLGQGLASLDKDYRELRFESLGPSLGRELVRKTIIAVILSSLTLLLFIARRFSDPSFGISAVLAMLHDAFILIGSFSLFGKFFGAELDALFVTALLTTLSASVHDTIVIFDRIRELRRTDYRLDWVDLANKAVTETIVRSINNSMTIIIMLVALVMLGGPATRWFATALLVGVVAGTYSSTGVAIPLVLFFKSRQRKK